MWEFYAKYTNVNTEKEISRKIEFDGENMPSLEEILSRTELEVIQEYLDENEE